MRENIEQIQIQHDLRQEYQQDIERRAKRYLSVRPHKIIPFTHFAAVSSPKTSEFSQASTQWSR